jgi:hypothetical protein
MQRTPRRDLLGTTAGTPDGPRPDSLEEELIMTPTGRWKTVAE